ncbi:MAG: UTP--glucose-1-phosphate uridylyltransferase [Clostridia bacterium]|nr:UTP--glucose-1-phosphate uridylyltransferase [Clostridia bacterium]
MKKIKKAVIPVAGYGTRFLPYTKAVPKAMLPIINKPAIQIITEEVINSGITDILFVVGYKHDVIESHFSKSNELDRVLLEQAKTELYDAIKYPETMARITFATQTELNGTAKAIETAKNFINGEPFAILFGDDVMYNKEVPVIKQLIDVYNETGKTVIGCKNVTKEEVTMYASVEYDYQEGKVYNATKITEKPKLEDVKSTISPLGRYVVTPDVFDKIKQLKPGKNGEYQFTDALDMIAKEGNCKALVFDGIRYDMGNRLGYLKANIEFGLRDEDLSQELKDYLKNLLENI